MDAPEIPDPQKSPKDEPQNLPPANGEPHMNGNGTPGTVPNIDPEKLIEWMKATDKEIKMVRIGQVVLCAAVILLLVTSAKSFKVPTAP